MEVFAISINSKRRKELIMIDLIAVKFTNVSFA